MGSRERTPSHAERFTRYRCRKSGVRVRVDAWLRHTSSNMAERQRERGKRNLTRIICNKTFAWIINCLDVAIEQCRRRRRWNVFALSRDIHEKSEQGNGNGYMRIYILTFCEVAPSRSFFRSFIYSFIQRVAHSSSFAGSRMRRCRREVFSIVILHGERESRCSKFSNACRWFDTQVKEMKWILPREQKACLPIDERHLEMQGNENPWAGEKGQWKMHWGWYGSGRYISVEKAETVFRICWFCTRLLNISFFATGFPIPFCDTRDNSQMVPCLLQILFSKTVYSTACR